MGGNQIQTSLNQMGQTMEQMAQEWQLQQWVVMQNGGQATEEGESVTPIQDMTNTSPVVGFGMMSLSNTRIPISQKFSNGFTHTPSSIGTHRESRPHAPSMLNGGLSSDIRLSNTRGNTVMQGTQVLEDRAVEAETTQQRHQSDVFNSFMLPSIIQTNNQIEGGHFKHFDSYGFHDKPNMIQVSDEIAMYLGANQENEMSFDDDYSKDQILSFLNYLINAEDKDVMTHLTADGHQIGSLSPEDAENKDFITRNLPESDDREHLFMQYKRTIDNIYDFFQVIPTKNMSDQLKVYMILRLKNMELKVYTNTMVEFMYNEIGLSREEIDKFVMELTKFYKVQETFKEERPDDFLQDLKVRITPEWRWPDADERQTYEYYVQSTNDYLQNYLNLQKTKLTMTKINGDVDSMFQEEWTTGADGGTYF